MSSDKTKKKALWPAGPPPAPDANLVMNDPSCHGILGLTLQQALQEDEEQEQDFTNAILKRLGASIAETQNKQTTTSTTTCALLRGRIDHYNRRNSKWRIVVKDATLRKRYPLDKRRRRKERVSLWQVAAEKKMPSDHDVNLDTTEILAYNDLV